MSPLRNAIPENNELLTAVGPPLTASHICNHGQPPQCRSPTGKVPWGILNPEVWVWVWVSLERRV